MKPQKLTELTGSGAAGSGEVLSTVRTDERGCPPAWPEHSVCWGHCSARWLAGFSLCEGVTGSRGPRATCLGG